MTKQYTFGSGILTATPANGLDPIEFAALQDVEIDFSGDLKSLNGQYGFPLAVGRGAQKVDVKAGNGAIDVDLYNSIFFGGTPASTGSKKLAQGESASIPASTPFTITVANGANFYANMQVLNVVTGTRMKQVASGPATGQYSLNAVTGVYTFAAADEGQGVIIDYLWTDTANGQTLQLQNQLIGVAPAFSLLLAEKFDQSTLVVKLNKVSSGKLTMPLKQADFMISDIEMMAYVDNTNSLGFISVTG